MSGLGPDTASATGNNQERSGEAMSDLASRIGADLQGFGGHLECTVCGGSAPLGNVGGKLANGWPKCCGYTMTWITRRQELERAAGRG